MRYFKQNINKIYTLFIIIIVVLLSFGAYYYKLTIFSNAKDLTVVENSITASSLKECDPLWANTKTNAEIIVNPKNNKYKKYTGQGTIIAVVDSGIDYSDPDLKNSMWKNTKEIDGNKIDDDKNGYIDDIYGYNFVDKTSPNAGKAYDPEELTRHGTIVAKLVAALDNSTSNKMAGIAPYAKVMSVQISIHGEGRAGEEILKFASVTKIAEAIKYAVNNGANVILNSWHVTLTDPKTIQELTSALNYADSKGVVIVSLAGNTNGDIKNLNYWPALYEKGLTIAATDINDKRWDNSSYGSLVDLAAPGKSIYTEDYYNHAKCSSGTSWSAPMVAGYIALLRNKYKNLSKTEIYSMVSKSVDKITTDQYIGTGRLNMASYILYDINSDKKINKFDIQAVSSRMYKPLVTSDDYVYDVNRDGVINVLDTTAISSKMGN